MATGLSHRSTRRALALALAIGLAPLAGQAADHVDAPLAGSNRSTDIADVYAFLDPNAFSFLIAPIVAQKGDIRARLAPVATIRIWGCTRAGRDGCTATVTSWILPIGRSCAV